MLKKANREEIEKAIRNASASLSIEGYLMRKNEEELVRKKLSGEITEKEFLKRIKEIVLEGDKDENL